MKKQHLALFQNSRKQKYPSFIIKGKHDFQNVQTGFHIAPLTMKVVDEPSSLFIFSWAFPSGNLENEESKLEKSAQS
jgi:hypothetical protein